MEASELTEAIQKAAQGSAVADLVAAVEVESARDEDGDEYLRVEVSLKPTARNVIADLRHLLTDIEELVAERDPRYPSVRFLDAA